MKHLLNPWSAAGLALAAVMTSCSEPPPPPPPTPPPVGRYQIATVAEGERGATLVLVDTTTGETWYYHAPVGQLFNGFWGNIPKAVTPDAAWAQAFQSMMQPPATNRAVPPIITPAP
jgi:hypothetical protein